MDAPTAYTTIWNHLQAANLGVPIVGPADGRPREESRPWARLTLRDYLAEDLTIGAKRSFWTVGAVWMQVFVPRGTGSTIQSLTLNEKVMKAFNGAVLGPATDRIVFQVGVFDQLDAQQGNDNWLMSVAEFPYRYLSTVGDAA